MTPLPLTAHVEAGPGVVAPLIPLIKTARHRRVLEGLVGVGRGGRRGVSLDTPPSGGRARHGAATPPLTPLMSGSNTMVAGRGR